MDLVSIGLLVVADQGQGTSHINLVNSRTATLTAYDTPELIIAWPAHGVVDFTLKGWLYQPQPHSE
jgi:hypothetical protein